MSRIPPPASIGAVLNMWTNDINEVAQTDIDFPQVAALETA